MEVTESNKVEIGETGLCLAKAEKTPTAGIDEHTGIAIYPNKIG